MTFVSLISSFEDDEDDLDVRAQETTGSQLNLNKEQQHALKGLPLSFQHTDLKKMTVFTKSVSKVCVAQKRFTTPSLKGYKRVDSEIGVLRMRKDSQPCRQYWKTSARTIVT